MEAPQVQQTVRRKPGNEESGRPVRDKVDVEGSTLEWSKCGKEEGRQVTRNGIKKDSYGDQSQNALKIEDRQTGRHSSGATAV